jgi:hypothetical protein
MAIFANGTYFVDTPHTNVIVLGQCYFEAETADIAIN